MNKAVAGHVAVLRGGLHRRRRRQEEAQQQALHRFSSSFGSLLEEGAKQGVAFDGLTRADLCFCKLLSSAVLLYCLVVAQNAPSCEPQILH